MKTKITGRTKGARGCYFLTSVSWRFLQVSIKDLEASLLYSTVASFLEFSEIPYLDNSVSCFEN